MHFRVREGAEGDIGHPPSPSEQPHSFVRAKTSGTYSRDSQTRTTPRRTAGSTTGVFGRSLKLLLQARALLRNHQAASPSAHESAWLAVTAAAAIGEVSEYNLFRAAWMAWYGTKADGEKTEKLFGACLNGAELPCHVRHFVRQLRSAGNDPALAFDRARFGLDRYPRKEALILP